MKLAVSLETAVEPAGVLLSSGPVAVRLGAVEALARMRHPGASAALERRREVESCLRMTRSAMS